MLRQDIINYWLGKFRTITTENGYYSDLGLNVYDYHFRDLMKNTPPTLILYDYGNVKDPDYSGGFKSTLTIRVDIIEIAPDVVNLRKLIVDVCRCLGKFENDFAVNFNAEIDFERDEMTHEKETVNVASAQVYFSITYTTKKWYVE